jgi:hypothetical protein
MTLRLREGLLTEVFSTLREHGAGQDECVVYLAGPLDTRSVVDELLHPEHAAFPGFYEIDQAWLHRTWLDLARRGREIRLQVHTHKFDAFHSETDDGYPIVNTAGFLSLVLPRFATGPVGLSDAYLTRLEADGRWHELDPAEELTADEY